MSRGDVLISNSIVIVSVNREKKKKNLRWDLSCLLLVHNCPTFSPTMELPGARHCSLLGFSQIRELLQQA